MRIGFILLFIVNSFNLLSQKENNRWFFTDNKELDFNSGDPIFRDNGRLLGLINAIVTVSDVNGDLLFYSDGISVWDKTQNIMPNGIALNGDWFSSQGVAVAPYPGEHMKYYIFSLQSGAKSGDLFYSMIDMNLNNGNGDVTSQKNVLLKKGLTEKMALTRGSCGTLWLVAHERQNNHFVSFRIKSDGLNENPVITSIGSDHFGTSRPDEDWQGKIRFMSDGKRLATSVRRNLIEVFDFDYISGDLTNPIKINLNINLRII